MKKIRLSQIKDISKKNLSDKKQSAEISDLIRNLDETKEELKELNQSLNYVTDPILLNQLIFQIKAAEVRYRYWYRTAREIKNKEIIEKTQTNV